MIQEYCKTLDVNAVDRGSAVALSPFRESTWPL